MKDNLELDPAAVDVPIIGHDHSHKGIHSHRYEGLRAIWDEDLKYPKVIGYVHPPSRVLFDEKHRFSNPQVFKASGPSENPAHMRRIELAEALLNKIANGLA